MLAAQTILDQKKKKAKKKSFVLFFHIRWLLFTYHANALALESFLQYAGEKGGRGMKSAKENLFLKARVLYNRMFSSRCLLF